MCEAEADGADDLREAIRQTELSLLTTIDKNRWAIQGVLGSTDPRDPGPEFAYTVGLSTLGLPELAIFGAPLRFGASVLNAVARRLVAGEAITGGTALSRDEDSPIEAVAIDMTDTSELLALTSIYGGVDAALQIVWVDPHGKLPWDRGWSMGDAQPLYGPPPW